MKLLKKQICQLTLAGIMVLALTGCGQKKKNYDVYFFNGKSEIASSLDELALKYKDETGKNVKIFTVGTVEGAETLRSELKSKDYPTVFTSGAISFEEWKSAGFATGIDDIQNEQLKELYESVPDTMKLQFEGQGNYGLPYNMEGYGLIGNKKMIMDILELDNIENFIRDYKEANYKEFQDMVKSIDIFIKDNKSQTFTLNGIEYKTSETKTDLTNNLNGIFSIAGAEKWTYGNHFGNYPISAIYKDIYDVRNADLKKVEALKIPLIKSLEQIEFLTNYAAGPNGPISRGSEFINSTVTGYDQAVQTFAEGKAVFIKNGNWIYGNIEKISEGVAKNLFMLPMKLNYDNSDIQVEGLTIEQMNRSIPEFVSQYYVINAKATEEERKAAEDFVLWLNTSETGKDFIVNKFAFVPFNADENTQLDNPLSNDLISYMVEGNLLANPFDAAPASWGLECYGKYIMENLFTNPEKWESDELEKIVDKCINYWKSGIDEW